MEENYTEEKITEEEKTQAQLNVDLLDNSIKATEFDLDNIKKQIEIKLPQRQAEAAALEAIRTKEIDLKRYQDQLGMYKKRVDTGMKQVPALNNEAE